MPVAGVGIENGYRLGRTVKSLEQLALGFQHALHCGTFDVAVATRG